MAREQKLIVGFGDFAAVRRRGRRLRRRRLRHGLGIDTDGDEQRGREKNSSFHTIELFHKHEELSYSSAMAVDPELLEILACPNCKTPVALVKNGTALKCATCHRVYPIKDDIPVMLIDEATIEPD